jgi:hypothetical protein
MKSQQCGEKPPPFGGVAATPFRPLNLGQVSVGFLFVNAKELLQIADGNLFLSQSPSVATIPFLDTMPWP